MDGPVAEAPQKMDNEEVAVKMSGYLEKRGKFRLVATWKRYWFVLEGRLLLYYGSEQDYINLSACRGSINMGLVSCVRPGSGNRSKQHEGFTIEVVTRTQLIVLRMKERLVHDQWLQALLDSTGGSSQAQTLTNSAGGTLRFRYSMDALPTSTKKEVPVEEKQSTLPRQKHDASKTHQQKIIQHIKRIGGKTYVGGLDTVLKVRNNVRSSDHRKDQTEQHTVNGCIPHKSPREVKKLANSSSTETLNENASNCIQEVENSQTLRKNSLSQNCESPLASNTHSCDQRANQLEHGHSGSFDTAEKPEAIKSSLQMPVIKQTQVVSDRCHVKDGLSEDAVCQVEPEHQVTENILYNQQNASYEIYGHNDNLSAVSAQHNEVKCSSISDLTKTEKGNQLEDNISLSLSLEEKHKSFTGSEDVYYSCYDKTSLMEQLKNEQLDSTEPELPPRPHMSPEPTGSRTDSTSTAADDNCYAEYCTLDALLSSSTRSTTSSVDDFTATKEKKKNRGKKKKKKQNESLNADGDGRKVKRKVSFIHKLIGKYHKKKKHYNGENVDVLQEDNDGTEYAVVDYTAMKADLCKETMSKKEQLSHCQDDDDDEACGTHVQKSKTAKSMLPNNTLQELQNRLKERTLSGANTGKDIEEEELDYEEEYATCRGVSNERGSNKTSSITTRKPIPVPRKNIGRSTEELADDLDNGSTVQTSNTPPQLPPRRLIRPRSPWHDVPSNNSPVYGNFEELFGTRPRDSLLGTQEGFEMIKNKWQAAEGGGNGHRTRKTQWNREHRQVAFPSRLGQRVLQWQEEASYDPADEGCSHKDKNPCTKHTVSAVVEAHIPQDLCTDAAACERNNLGSAVTPSGLAALASLGEGDMNDLPLANDCNGITLPASGQSEYNFQSCEKHDNVPQETRETNKEMSEKEKNELDANINRDNPTKNIRDVTDIPLPIDGHGEFSKNDPLVQSLRKSNLLVSESANSVINVEQKNISEGIKPLFVEKDANRYTSVSSVLLTRKEVEQLENTNACALATQKNCEDIDPDSLMSDSASQCSVSLHEKLEPECSNELLVHESSWNICKCISEEGCKNCTKKVNKKQLPDPRSVAEKNSDDSLENFEEVELRKPATTNGPMCPTCSLKDDTARDVIFDGTKAIQCIRYDNDGCITEKQVVPVTKRYSDELNLLLAQLAEITSAPLLSPGVTISLVDFPEKRKHPGQTLTSEFDEWAAIGPIRRRRHSDPDYDVPRPHRSLLQLLLSGGEMEQPENHDVIESTKFFGKADACAIQRLDSPVSDSHNSSWPEHMKSEPCSENTRSSKNIVQSHTDTSSCSITPDSLELDHH